MPFGKPDPDQSVYLIPEGSNMLPGDIQGLNVMLMALARGLMPSSRMGTAGDDAGGPADNPDAAPFPVPAPAPAPAPDPAPAPGLQDGAGAAGGAAGGAAEHPAAKRKCKLGEPVEMPLLTCDQEPPYEMVWVPIRLDSDAQARMAGAAEQDDGAGAAQMDVDPQANDPGEGFVVPCGDKLVGWQVVVISRPNGRGRIYDLVASMAAQMKEILAPNLAGAQLRKTNLFPENWEAFAQSLLRLSNLGITIRNADEKTHARRTLAGILRQSSETGHGELPEHLGQAGAPSTLFGFARAANNLRYLAQRNHTALHPTRLVSAGYLQGGNALDVVRFTGHGAYAVSCVSHMDPRRGLLLLPLVRENPFDAILSVASGQGAIDPTSASEQNEALKAHSCESVVTSVDSVTLSYREMSSLYHISTLCSSAHEQVALIAGLTETAEASVREKVRQTAREMLYRTGLERDRTSAAQQAVFDFLQGYAAKRGKEPFIRPDLLNDAPSDPTLGPWSDYVVKQVAAYSVLQDVENLQLPLLLGILVLNSAFHYDFEGQWIALYVMYIGNAAVGKSFILELMEKLGIPTTVITFDHMTEKSRTNGRNCMGETQVVHENTEAVGATAAGLRLMKSQMTRAINGTTSVAFEKDTGRRTSQQTYTMGAASFVTASNNPAIKDPALLTRMMLAPITVGAGSGDAAAQSCGDAVLSAEHLAAAARYKERFQLTQAFCALLHQWLAIKAVCPISMHFYHARLNDIQTAMREAGYVADLSRRQQQQMEVMVKTMVLIMAAETLFFAPNAHFAMHPLDLEDLAQLVQPLLYATAEMADFTFTLMHNIIRGRVPEETDKILRRLTRHGMVGAKSLCTAEGIDHNYVAIPLGTLEAVVGAICSENEEMPAPLVLEYLQRLESKTIPCPAVLPASARDPTTLQYEPPGKEEYRQVVKGTKCTQVGILRWYLEKVRDSANLIGVLDAHHYVPGIFEGRLALPISLGHGEARYRMLCEVVPRPAGTRHLVYSGFRYVASKIQRLASIRMAAVQQRHETTRESIIREFRTRPVDLSRMTPALLHGILHNIPIARVRQAAPMSLMHQWFMHFVAAERGVNLFARLSRADRARLFQDAESTMLEYEAPPPSYPLHEAYEVLQARVAEAQKAGKNPMQMTLDHGALAQAPRYAEVMVPPEAAQAPHPMHAVAVDLSQLLRRSGHEYCHLLPQQ